ncbi:MAG: WbqC family protein [Gammaproteobacteria bacterium]|nr:WbqC family protein [Gammaproteobacteria bacterium]
MRLGIMQPYFFPYLGYFELMARTDRWIVFDVVRYSPKTWMNRNRILHPTRGWQYVTVPVIHAADMLIRDVRVVDRPAAAERILGQMDHYRVRRAPHFSEVRELVRGALLGGDSDLLRDVNVRALALTCACLGIDARLELLSGMDLALPEITAPGGWALEISSALGAAEYLNPPGGRELFDPEAFAARGIRLSFTELREFGYDSRPYPFIPHLSILDVLMWNEPQRVHEFLCR